jgi:hypothetical protein
MATRYSTRWDSLVRTSCWSILIAGLAMVAACSPFGGMDSQGDEWDPRDDALETATYLGSPAVNPETHGSHTLSSSDTADWFAVSLEANGEYEFWATEASEALRGELYSVDNGLATLVGTSGACSGYAGFYLAIGIPTAGRYYLRVMTEPLGSQDSYALHCKLAAPLLPDAWDLRDNSAANATILQSPTAALQQHGPHTLSISDNIDWYAVYLSSGRSYEFTADVTRGDSLLWLYADLQDSYLLYNDDGGSGLGSRIAFTPAAEGWYYLAVTPFQNQQTAYMLSSRLFQPERDRDPWDPTDDDAAGGTTLSVPLSTVTTHGPHTLSSVDPADWFTVYLSSGESYRIEAVGNSGDTVGTLYRSDGAALVYVASDDDSGAGAMFRIDYVARGSGWYRLCVRAFGEAGPVGYTLAYSVRE